MLKPIFLNEKFQNFIKISLKWVPKGPINNKQAPGGRLNKKDGLTRYGDSHVKDKTS